MSEIGQAVGCRWGLFPNLLSFQPELCDRQDFPFGCQQVLRFGHPESSGAPISLSLIENYEGQLTRLANL